MEKILNQEEIDALFRVAQVICEELQAT